MLHRKLDFVVIFKDLVEAKLYLVNAPRPLHRLDRAARCRSAHMSPPLISDMGKRRRSRSRRAANAVISCLGLSFYSSFSIAQPAMLFFCRLVADIVDIIREVHAFPTLRPVTLYTLAFIELLSVRAALGLCIHANSDESRKKLWEVGGERGFNSDPKQRIRLYANYRPIPKVP